MKIRPVGVVIIPGGQTDGRADMTKLTVAGKLDPGCHNKLDSCQTAVTAHTGSYMHKSSLNVGGCLFVFLALQPVVVVVFEVSRSHTTTRQSVGLLWTSDQPVAETST